MNPLLIAAVIAAKKQSERHYHRPRKSSSSESSYSSRTCCSQPKFIDCVKKEMSYYCPALLEFFNMVYERYNEEYSKFIDGVEKEIKNLNSEISGIISLNASNLSMISRKGIKIRIDEYRYSFIINDNTFSMNIFKDEYYKLSTEKLEESKESNLREITKIENKISELKNTKIFFLNKRKKEEKKNDIDYYEYTLKQRKQKVEEINSQIDLYQKINSFNNEERKCLKSIVESIDKLKKLKAEVSNKSGLISSYSNDSYYNRINNDIMKQTYEKMVQDGEITPEKLEKIVYYLDKVEIKAKRGEYNFKYYSSTEEGRSDTLENLVQWFITNVYEADEDFVYRNHNIDDDDKSLVLKKKED